MRQKKYNLKLLLQETLGGLTKQKQTDPNEIRNTKTMTNRNTNTRTNTACVEVG